MRKRARITLGLEPESAEAEAVAGATLKTASKAAATAESRLAARVATGSKASTEAQPRAKAKAGPEAEAKPEAKKQPSRESVMENGPELQTERTAGPRLHSKAGAGHRPNTTAAPQYQDDSGFHGDPAEATQPSGHSPDMLNLGTVLKAAVVGLVVVTVVLWLKKRP